MTTGVTGFGIGVLFYVVSALALPFFEIARSLAGHGSWTRWKSVVRQFTVAVAMVASVGATMEIIGRLFGLPRLAGIGMRLIHPAPWWFIATLAVAAAVSGGLGAARRSIAQRSVSRTGELRSDRLTA